MAIRLACVKPDSCRRCRKWKYLISDDIIYLRKELAGAPKLLPPNLRNALLHAFRQSTWSKLPRRSGWGSCGRIILASRSGCKTSRSWRTDTVTNSMKVMPATQWRSKAPTRFWDANLWESPPPKNMGHFRITICKYTSPSIPKPSNASVLTETGVTVSTWSSKHADCIW